MSMTDEKRRGATLGDVARATGGRLTGGEAVPVVDVSHDSRQVRGGWLFVAVRGAQTDGNRFIEQARAQGAAGVVSDNPCPANFEGAWIEVSDARRALARAAAEVQGHPSRELQLVGITGTNGKTTTAYLVAAMAESAGDAVALLGTVEYRIGGERFKAEYTTPEASDVQRLLRRAVAANCRVAVMEASSQALDLHRCDALEFGVAVFTNLTRDHLDYHKTMDAYFAAKRRLFDGTEGSPSPRVSVVNADDERGRELAQELKGRASRVITYGLREEAEVSARDVEFSMAGTSFTLRTAEGDAPLHSPLVGRPHIYNILAAAATAHALGYTHESVARAVGTCTGAPGRFERVDFGEHAGTHAGEFAVVVDYAHTDDALANVLRTARDVTRGRVITVFGCGGMRDRTKRAPMGEVAARLSDVVILTSDNPRTEDPERIFADIEEGLRRAARPYLKIADRRAAIQRAVAEAQDGDVVLIAGKGHEDYQIIGTEKLHFDDKEVAREALAARVK